jgi:type VI secretion system protein VasJ
MPFSADYLSTLATTSCEGDNPAGLRIAGFGKLDELVFAKLFNTLHPDPESVDWAEVLEEGVALLERSRDLRFARWVAHALLETRGLEGLELGIRLLSDLAGTFGTDLWPADHDKRIREMSGFDDFGAATLDRLGPREGGDPGRTLGALETLEESFSSFPGGSLPGLKRIGEWLSRTYPDAKSAASSPAEEDGVEGGAVEEGAADAATPPPEETKEAEVPSEAQERPEETESVAEESPAQKPARFQDLGTSPISESDPAGPRLTDWGRLATEYFQKLSSPTASGQIDWRSVRDSALELLETSKDIRAALVAVTGLMRTEGLTGLADGLELLALLGSSFGDNLHPRDPGDRLKKIAAFDLEASAWFAEKRSGISMAALEMLDGVAQQARQARAALGTICGDDMIFVRIGKAAEDRQKELEAEEEERKAAAAAPPVPAVVPGAGASPAPPASSAPAAAPTANIPASIESSDEADRALANARKLVRAAANHYREVRGDEAFVRRLERIGLWLHVTDTPPDSVITGPLPETVDRLNRESATGRVSLEDLEEQIEDRPLWLTGQRLLFELYTRQNRLEEAESIRAETAALVASLPGIGDIRFLEGVPLIDDETVAWLGAGGGGGDSGGAEAVPLDSEEEQEARQALRGEAKDLASEGKLPEAIALYQAAWRQSRSARQSFLWKLELARFCTTRSPTIASSVLGDLEDEIADKGISTWEPDLAIVVYTELLKLISDGDSARQQELFGKLVSVDPQKAATLELSLPNKQ